MTEPTTEPPVVESEIARDQQWQRLDPRMLLVHPVRELVRFIPFLLIAFVAGNSQGGDVWHYAAVAIPVALGLLRYLTTTFRISAARVELRRGLLNRHVLSTPIDRVRTVDLTASPIHRVLGLSTVRIGTGTTSHRGEERLDLDALPTPRARELRRELLRQSDEDQVDEDQVDEDRLDGDRVHAAGGPSAYVPIPAWRTPPGREVVRFEPVWLLYAPLTSSGVVIAVALLGAASQVLNGANLWSRLPDAHLGGLTWGVVAVLTLVALLGTLVVVSLLAVAGYALTNWDFTLVRSHAGTSPSWDLRRGLLTTRDTSIDAGRVRGVSLGTPLSLRLAGAARLTAVVTGLDRKQRGSAVLVPPAPRNVATRAAAAVLEDGTALDAPLTPHGPRARRRRYSRALLGAGLVDAALVAVVLVGGLPHGLIALALLPPAVALALAADRARGLGHRVDARWLTLQSGCLTRRRVVLQNAGIIGWTFHATWFQRRLGLVTLVATTAGGRQSYAALDVPDVLGVDLARRAVPGLLEPFLERG